MKQKRSQWIDFLYGMRSGYGGYFSLDLVRSGAPAAHNVSIGSEQKGYIHATILHADPVG